MSTARRTDTRIELLRIVGALSVFTYHLVGDIRLAVWPTAGPSTWWVAAFEPFGSFGVALFVVLSGTVFTWAWPRVRDSVDFIRRRLAALFPLYWWAAVPLIVLALLAHRMPLGDLWKVPLWLSGLGIVSPATFLPVVDAWWYMSLALQLVLVYPILRKAQNRVGAETFVLGSAVVTLASVWTLRTLGLDYANMGFVGSRLAEFAIGMTIGKFSAAGATGWPRARVLVSAAVALVVSAIALGDRPLVAVAPAVVWLAVGGLKNASGRLGGWLVAAGGLSFAFYLTHSPWAKPILTAMTRVLPPAPAVALGSVLSLAAAVAIAWGFQSSFAWANRLWRARRSDA